MSESNSSEPIVLVEDVSKEYRRDEIVIPVLSGMNLRLDQGDYMALMGPSGSGKSTLLNLIAGLDRPTSGNVFVCGQNLGTTSESELAKWRSRHVGFIFQMYNLIPVLTAYENVELPLTLTHLNRRQRDEQVRHGAGSGRFVRSHRPLPATTFRRSGTASFHRAGDCHRSHPAGGRRADGGFGRQVGERDSGPDVSVESGV